MTDLWEEGCKLHNLALATAQRAPEAQVLPDALRAIAAQLNAIFLEPVDPNARGNGSQTYRLNYFPNLAKLKESTGYGAHESTEGGYYSAPSAIKAFLHSLESMRSFEKVAVAAVGADALERFEGSFAHLHPVKEPECAELITLCQMLKRFAERGGPAWMRGWQPLQVLRHGGLDTSHILLDRLGSLWIPDLSKASVGGPFDDAAQLVASILFEHLIPSTRHDADAATAASGRARQDTAGSAAGSYPPGPASTRTRAESASATRARAESVQKESQSQPAPQASPRRWLSASSPVDPAEEQALQQAIAVVNALVPVNNKLPSYWEEQTRALKKSAPPHMVSCLQTCQKAIRAACHLVVRCGLLPTARPAKPGPGNPSSGRAAEEVGEPQSPRGRRRMSVGGVTGHARVPSGAASLARAAGGAESSLEEGEASHRRSMEHLHSLVSSSQRAGVLGVHSEWSGNMSACTSLRTGLRTRMARAIESPLTVVHESKTLTSLLDAPSVPPAGKVGLLPDDPILSEASAAAPAESCAPEGSGGSALNSDSWATRTKWPDKSTGVATPRSTIFGGHLGSGSKKPPEPEREQSEFRLEGSRSQGRASVPSRSSLQELSGGSSDRILDPPAARVEDDALAAIAQDCHPANFQLQLLLRGLEALLSPALSLTQKRLAFHTVQRLSTALCMQLERPPVTPPGQVLEETQRPLEQLHFCANQHVVVREGVGEGEGGAERYSLQRLTPSGNVAVWPPRPAEEAPHAAEDADSAVPPPLLTRSTATIDDSMSEPSIGVQSATARGAAASLASEQYGISPLEMHWGVLPLRAYDTIEVAVRDCDLATASADRLCGLIEVSSEPFTFDLSSRLVLRARVAPLSLAQDLSEMLATACDASSSAGPDASSVGASVEVGRPCAASDSSLAGGKDVEPDAPPSPTRRRASISCKERASAMTSARLVQMVRNRLGVWCGHRLLMCPSVSLKRYSPGKQLYVHALGAWRQAHVVSSYTGKDIHGEHTMSLTNDGGERVMVSAKLTPYNSGPCLLEAHQFETYLACHVHKLRTEHSVLVNQLTGRRTDIFDQMVPLAQYDENGTQVDKWRYVLHSLLLHDGGRGEASRRGAAEGERAAPPLRGEAGAAVVLLRPSLPPVSV